MYAPGIVARTNKEPAVQQTIVATSDGDDTDSSNATQQRQAKVSHTQHTHSLILSLSLF